MPIGVRKIKHAHVRRETSGFAHPIKHERTRNDDQGWSVRPADVCAGLRHGEHHHRFAQPHVVGETAAKPELTQKPHPTKRLALILAKLTVKSARRIFGVHPSKRRNAACARESFVPVDVGLRRATHP